MIRKNLFLAVLFVLLFQSAKSVTWIANSSGYWNSGYTWSTGIAPPYTSSDTFLIQSFVALTNNLVFTAGAHVQIDSTGGLCGHNTLHLDSGTTMIKYGILELDIFLVSFGQATFLPPGPIIFTQYAVLTGLGTSLIINGPSMSVGPWFNCLQPAYSFISGIEEISESKIRFFPNPSDGHFTLSCPFPFQKGLCRLRDVTGRIVYEKNIFFQQDKESIDASYLPTGIYYWEMNTDNFSERGKVEVMK